MDTRTQNVDGIEWTYSLSHYEPDLDSHFTDIVIHYGLVKKRPRFILEIEDKEYEKALKKVLFEDIMELI